MSLDPPVARPPTEVGSILSELSETEYPCDPTMDDPVCDSCRRLFEPLFVMEAQLHAFRDAANVLAAAVRAWDTRDGQAPLLKEDRVWGAVRRLVALTGTKDSQ